MADANSQRATGSIGEGRELSVAVADGSGTAGSTAAGTHAEESAEDASVPVTPVTIHNMQALLKRPFGDVLKEVIANLQLKSTAHLAAEQLRYLLHHDSSHQPEVLASPVLGLLVGIIRESPGLPVAGAAMGVLAMLALTPHGRAALRAEGALPPVMKFLTLPGVLSKPNAEPALLLLQNASCDKLCRALMHKADGMALLLDLLGQHAGWLRQHTKLSGAIAGCLANLVVADTDSSTAKQKFVKSGGVETACRALAEWGRTDSSPATLRLRLLLNEISSTPQYTMRVQETALDACSLSARLPALAVAAAQPAGPGSSRAAGALAAPAVPARGAAEAAAAADATAGVAGKGVPLGTPRMPASDRITSEVLKHGKDNSDAADEGST